MKTKFVALRLYILGLVVGFSIFGWTLIVRLEHENASAQNTPAIVMTGNTTSVSALPDLRPIPEMPRIRTRSS